MASPGSEPPSLPLLFNDRMPTMRMGTMRLLFPPSPALSSLWTLPAGEPDLAWGVSLEELRDSVLRPLSPVGLSLFEEPNLNILKKSNEAGLRCAPSSFDSVLRSFCPRCCASRPVRKAWRNPSNVPSSPSTASATFRRSFTAVSLWPPIRDAAVAAAASDKSLVSICELSSAGRLLVPLRRMDAVSLESSRAGVKDCMRSAMFDIGLGCEPRLLSAGRAADSSVGPF